jgi:hypothetical protein
MNRNIDVVVTTEMVGIESPILKESGKFTKLIWNENMATGTFERYGTRLEVSLTKVLESQTYIVTVPNFYFCMVTKTPQNVAYKLVEKDILRVDAESVEMAMRYMKQMIDEYKEYLESDVYSHLVIANHRLGKAYELLLEANKDGGQMDFISHPSLANVFDSVYMKAQKIDKIMYQK